MKCKLCDKEFNGFLGLPGHLRHNHNEYTVQKYYDKFYKKEGEGICRYCGKPTKFRTFVYGYNKYCNPKCANNDPEVRNKFKEKCIEKYGVDNPNKCKEIIEKRKETCTEKYGVDSYMKTPEFREKAVESNQSKETKEKRKQTNLERYGVEMPFQSKEIQNKIKETCLERYGVDNVRKVPEIMQNKGNSHEARVKAAKTRRKNGNNSKLEDYFEDRLKELNIKFKKEYNKDKRYPYHCDFYIPEKDLFIEIHGFPGHGEHWFNKNNSKDIKKLNTWEEKTNGKDLYSTFIFGWTIDDVKKREMARKNKLNYVILWNKKDIDDWFNFNCPSGQDWKEEYTWKK